MSKLKYGLLLLCVGAASTQLAQAHTEWHGSRSLTEQGAGAARTLNASPVPTVVVPDTTPAPVPTVLVPKPTPKPKPTPRPKHAGKHPVRTATPHYSWIWAFLTSYCPGTAGWISSSGAGVFYGMLANDYYPFGTRVYMPVLGMTGVVEDRFGGWVGWNYFDVWSPVCYATPTGWFKVGVVR